MTMPIQDSDDQGKMLLHVWSDSEQAGDIGTRQNRSSVCISADGVRWFSSGSRQAAIMSEGGEKEFDIVEEAMLIREVLMHFGAIVETTSQLDCAAACEIFDDEAVGHVRHPFVRELWLRQSDNWSVIQEGVMSGMGNTAICGAKTSKRDLLEHICAKCCIKELSLECDRDSQVESGPDRSSMDSADRSSMESDCDMPGYVV